MADRLQEFAEGAQDWARQNAERATELAQAAAERAIELAQSAGSQALGHLQEWAESGAEHHHSRADDRAKLSVAARSRALPHFIGGLLGHEPSAKKAAELHSAADEHDAAMVGHRLAAIALGLTSAGLRQLLGGQGHEQDANTSQLPEGPNED